MLHFPEIPTSGGMTSQDLLHQKAQAGAARLYGQISPDFQARLDHELAVIGEYGYASLFLIVEEILNFARQEGIPFSSRGSAASSLVAHCLGITSPTRSALNLYFERFLNPARATPPDIDTDLCSRRRDEVIRFVYQRFGEDRVATVCTINRFRSRSALREVAKAYGLPADEVSRLADSLPYRWYGPSRRGGSQDDPFGELSRTVPLRQPTRRFSRCSCPDRATAPSLRPPWRGGDQPGTADRPGAHPDGSQRGDHYPVRPGIRSNAWDWSRSTCWASAV